MMTPPISGLMAVRSSAVLIDWWDHTEEGREGRGG
jgi:hypothetical protein